MLVQNARHLGFIVPWSGEHKMAQAAQHQVQAARSLAPLKSVRNAEGISYFKTAPGSVSDARFHSAYWTAVGARLSLNRSLASTATKMLGHAMLRASQPGSTTLFRGSPQEITETMQQAITALQDVPGAEDALKYASRSASLPAVSTAHYQKKTGSDQPDRDWKWWSLRIGAGVVGIGLIAFLLRSRGDSSPRRAPRRPPAREPSYADAPRSNPKRKNRRAKKGKSKSRRGSKRRNSFTVRDRKAGDGIADDVNGGTP